MLHSHGSEHLHGSLVKCNESLARKDFHRVGDSGGNQGGQRYVADLVTGLWKGAPVVAHVQEYYDYAGAQAHMRTKGIADGPSDNLHDDPVIALNMFMDDPKSIRYDERVKAGKATINGVSLADRKKATE